jgi:hypothetical protein
LSCPYRPSEVRLSKLLPGEGSVGRERDRERISYSSIVTSMDGGEVKTERCRVGDVGVRKLGAKKSRSSSRDIHKVIHTEK